MTIFGGFITGGTVSTDLGDATKLTFSGIVINGALGAVAGDTFSAGGYQVPIASIDGTGAATLVYAFPVALDDEADYAIARDSAERYNPAATNLLVRQYFSRVGDPGITYTVPDNADGPDEQIISDPQEGQKAIRYLPLPWTTWLYTEGAWVEQPGSPGGPGADGATWLAQDAEPTTDYPPNSLWLDTDSAGLDVYELSGSPLDWVSLGFGLKGEQGNPGTPGAPGDDGTDGLGVPAGGTTGQVLAKASDTDNDTQWIDPPGGGAGGSWNRNLCTNPAMQVWQNDTTLVAMGHRTVLADGWLFGVWNNGAASSSVWTATRSTDVPDSSVPFSLSLTAASAETPLASTSERHIRWAIYGREFAPYASGDMKARFWVKAKKTGIYSVACLNETRTQSYINEYTVNAADTWEEKTITIPFGSKSGTWNLGDGYGFGLRWSLGAGSSFRTTAGAWQSGNYTSSTNQVNAADASDNYLKITKVQICPVSLPDFDLPSFQEVFEAALRQYRVIDTDAGGVNFFGIASSVVSVNFDTTISPPMMAPPTISYKGTLDTDLQLQSYSGTPVTGGTFSSFARSKGIAKWAYTVSSGLTAGDFYAFRLVTTSGKLVIDGHLG